MDRLYQLAQRLLALDPKGLRTLARSNCSRSLKFGQCACLTRPKQRFTARAIRTGKVSRIRPGRRIPPAEILPDLRSGVLIRCLFAGGNKIGAIAFEGLGDPELTAGPLSALAAAMLERTHTFRNASHAAAAAQAELFRGAVFWTLYAHEFKTPLATILTAAGSLREVGPLCADESELAEIIETEAATAWVG